HPLDRLAARARGPARARLRRLSGHVALLRLDEARRARLRPSAPPEARQSWVPARRPVKPRQRRRTAPAPPRSDDSARTRGRVQRMESDHLLAAARASARSRFELRRASQKQPAHESTAAAVQSAVADSPTSRGAAAPPWRSLRAPSPCWRAVRRWAAPPRGRQRRNLKLKPAARPKARDARASGLIGGGVARRWTMRNPGRHVTHRGL